MKYYRNGKHFYGETVHSHVKVDKLVSVRLSASDIEILEKHYPGFSLSFQIRSAIRDLDCKNQD